jgi:F420-dependent oxidoreductase-like protein
MGRVKLGLQIPNYSAPNGPGELPRKLAEIARAADEAGFDSLWTPDHLFFTMGDMADSMLESYTTQAFLAAATRCIRIGALVTPATFRNPGLLVKAVTTLDVLSGGRANLGIGAGGTQREHVGLGIDLPARGARVERLRETMEIALQMWSGQAKPYRGKHFQLEETLCSPQPISKPHPPILIGGGGEQGTLRVVARYADMWNFFGDPSYFRFVADVLRERCAEVGRPYDDIEKTLLDWFVLVDETPRDAPEPWKNKHASKEEGQAAFRSRYAKDVPVTTPKLVEALAAQAEAGVQHSILALANVWDIEPIYRIGRDVLPQVRSL